MSETDEGSNGFEILDEEVPVEVKEQTAPTKTRKQRKSDKKVPTSPSKEPPKKPAVKSDKPIETQVSAMPSDVKTPTIGDTQPIDASAQPDDKSDSIIPPQLNAEMMWSGLQWGASLLTKVTEKAKESMDKVITTLDPQMKPILFSGGDLTVIVCSDKDDKVMPIQDAFWDVFGRATVEGIKAQPSSMAAQPVGFTAGLKAAEDRIVCLRSSGDVGVELPMIAVEGFLAELSTDRWFEMSCVLLEDKPNDISLSVYTQATPIQESWINQIKDGTPADYPLSWCGFAKTIGEVASTSLKCDRSEWHEKHTGLPRSATIYQAARSLAHLYQESLREKQAAAEAAVGQSEEPVVSQ